MKQSEFLEQLMQSILQMLEKKRKDYGGSYEKLRDEFGTVAFYIRLKDKLTRLQQVDANGDSVGEAPVDTIKDIIGYCLLELQYRQGGDKCDKKC